MVHNVWPYLGSLGRLVEIPFTTSESVAVQERYVGKTTVEGRRRVQARPASPRSWDVSMPLAKGVEASALAAFVSGAWGAGPFHWVSVQAQRGNLLTPREAMLVDHVPSSFWTTGGSVVAVDGTLAPRSVIFSVESSWRSLFVDIPCIPGTPVTWSADISGDGSANPALASVFADANGAQIGSGVTEYAPDVDGLQRVSQTRIPPEGAASFRAGIFHTTKRITRPQVTWTDGPVPFAPGHGCRAAVLDGVSEDLLVANSFGTWSSASFTVMEVG